jgi:homoserine O-acetyltransferase/O-succinyltransferase
MSDHETFNAGDVALQCGITLRDAKLAYKTHGKLNADKSNVVLFPTRFSGRHNDNEYLIGEDKALDPREYFIVVPNLFGNGVSSSPSNTPQPLNAGRFPGVTVYDNVLAQRKMLASVFGIDRLTLALGWSMGALQAYQWAALWPDKVERIFALCGSARCAPHNYVFLDGVKVALQTDAAFAGGFYTAPPAVGLRAMGRVWAACGLSQTFFRRHMYREMGFATVEDFLVNWWEWLFQQRDANNLLALVWTWQHADLSANPVYNGDFEKALGAIEARAIVMPCRTDMYFPPEDNAYEVEHMKRAELRVIDSVWGHYAGGGRDTASLPVIDRALRDLLAR